MAEIKSLQQFFKIKIFKKKQRILCPGETAKHFYFIYKGLIRQYYIAGDKREINTLFAVEGEIACSAFSCFSEKPSVYFIEAVETSTLLCVDIKDMDFIMSQGQKFTHFVKLLMAQLFLVNEARERELLSYDAASRVNAFLQKKPLLASRLQQNYIASYLNIKPETFCKLKKMSQKKNNRNLNVIAGTAKKLDKY